MANTLKTSSSSSSGPGDTDNSSEATDLQRFINMRAVRLLNDYCHRARPEDAPVEGEAVPVPAPAIEPRRSSVAGEERRPETIHRYCRKLDEYVRYAASTEKNVELLQESERVCSLINGLRVTFCKSGKDRTGMAVTLEQSRVLGERFSCGNSQERLLRDAMVMREHGCRILVAEKNIGRKVYSINSLQAQFIPLLYRPPQRVQENLIKSGDTS